MDPATLGKESDRNLLVDPATLGKESDRNLLVDPATLGKESDRNLLVDLVVDPGERSLDLQGRQVDLLVHALLA